MVIVSIVFLVVIGALRLRGTANAEGLATIFRTPARLTGRDAIELMALGLLSLPVIIIGDKKLTGFNPKAIDAALSAS